MRCQACDKLLTDFESTRKSATYEDFLDLCNDCYSTIRDEVKSLDRTDLMTVHDIIDIDDDSC